MLSVTVTASVLLSATLIASAYGASCSFPGATSFTTALSSNSTAQWLDLPHPDKGWGSSNLKANQTLINAALLQAVALRAGVLVTLRQAVNASSTSKSSTQALKSLGVKLADWEPSDDEKASDFINNQLSKKRPVVAIIESSSQDVVFVVTGTTLPSKDAPSSAPLCFDVAAGRSQPCPSNVFKTATLYGLPASDVVLSVSPSVFTASTALLPCTPDDRDQPQVNITIALAVRLNPNTPYAVVYRSTANGKIPLRSVSRVATGNASTLEQEFTLSDNFTASDDVVAATVYSALSNPNAPTHHVATSWVWPIIDVCIVVGAISLFVGLYLSGRVGLPRSMKSPSNTLDESLEPSHGGQQQPGNGYGTCP